MFVRALPAEPVIERFDVAVFARATASIDSVPTSAWLSQHTATSLPSEFVLNDSCGEKGVRPDGHAHTAGTILEGGCPPLLPKTLFTDL